MPTLPTPDFGPAAGSTLGLALVVLVQYVCGVFRLSASRGRTERAETGERDATVELEAVRREIAFAKLENHILREFLAETRPDRAVELLLRRFVPRPDRGFAALFEPDPDAEHPNAETAGPGDLVCRFARGLTDNGAGLRLSAGEAAVVRAAGLVELQGLAVGRCPLAAALDRVDLLKASRLYLIAVGDPEEPAGVLVTTGLYPAGGPPAGQNELARRLMVNLAAKLRDARLLRDREARLRLASEMLDLRAIADRPYESPGRLIEACLTAVRGKVAADAAALFLFRPGDVPATPAICRSGGPEPTGQAARWREFESRLATSAVGLDRPRGIGPEALRAARIDTLMRSALLVPFRRDSAVIGVVVLSRSDARPFAPADRMLADRAVTLLGEVVPRAVSAAAIERQARRDGLTGLANRRTFDAAFAFALDQSRRTGTEVALLLCDLDRFKSVNDNHGHQAGDEVLKAAAGALEAVVQGLRSSDAALVARYGGEEIAVLLPGFGIAGARRVAESARAAIEQTEIPIDGGVLRVTMSLGVAVAPGHGDTPETLLARADEALYAAKSSGRNRAILAGEPIALPAVG